PLLAQVAALAEALARVLGPDPGDQLVLQPAVSGGEAAGEEVARIAQDQQVDAAARGADPFVVAGLVLRFFERAEKGVLVAVDEQVLAAQPPRPLGLDLEALVESPPAGQLRRPR